MGDGNLIKCGIGLIEIFFWVGSGMWERMQQNRKIGNVNQKAEVRRRIKDTDNDAQKIRWIKKNKVFENGQFYENTKRKGERETCTMRETNTDKRSKQDRDKVKG